MLARTAGADVEVGLEDRPRDKRVVLDVVYGALVVLLGRDDRGRFGTAAAADG